MLKVIFERKILFIYIPLAIHWITIFILTSLPGDSLPEFAFDDKVKHFIAYFVLSVFLTITFKVQERYKKFKEHFIKFAFIIAIIYSTFDEIHQAFIPGRSAEILDWIANLLGILLGIYAAYRFLLKFNTTDTLAVGTESE